MDYDKEISKLKQEIEQLNKKLNMVIHANSLKYELTNSEIDQLKHKKKES